MKNPTAEPSVETHYSRLLGLAAPWSVRGVVLDEARETVEIRVAERDGSAFPCPECGAASPLHDHAPERRWRHLDAMQFRTEIVARIPRVSCAAHGVRTAAVPWAGAGARWTLHFEAFAVAALLCASSVAGASSLLRLGWGQAQAIRERAVARGLARRAEEAVDYVGIDEKSFLSGHRYASVMTDLGRGRVLEVVEGRTGESARSLIRTALSEAQLAGVMAAAMDMWRPFMDAWAEASPAPAVHDRFHVSKYLGEAVNSVRKSESRSLLAEGSDLLVGTKYLFLKNVLGTDEAARFRALMGGDLKVGRAWSLKEAFRHFWEYSRECSARAFFARWYFRATHSRLPPLAKVARTLKAHLPGLLSHCAHSITNAVTEGLNSKIQFVKAGARGFRAFRHYRTAILFYCGKLEMMPL